LLAEDEDAAELLRGIGNGEAVEVEIKRRVTNDVWTKIREQVLTSITKEVEAEIARQVAPRISEAVSAAISAGEITIGSRQVKIIDHVANLFNSSGHWNSVSDHVKNMADGHAKALKARYDVIFANRLVVKINEAGMLKEDVAKLLLEG